MNYSLLHDGERYYLITAKNEKKEITAYEYRELSHAKMQAINRKLRDVAKQGEVGSLQVPQENHNTN